MMAASWPASAWACNDVVTTIIDDALHHYLKDHKASIKVPLISLMAMSLRTYEHDAVGNIER